MKLKNAFFAVICAAAVFLTGCGKSKTVFKNGKAEIKNAGITVAFPEDWTVATDDDAYDELYKELSDGYESPKELKHSYEDNGERLLLNARSSDGNAAALFSELEKGEVGVEELLRSVHDTTVFDFRLSDFFTESSFGAYEWGGVSGYMSVIRVSEEDGASVLMEEREFCFERDGYIFSLKIHIIGGYEQTAEDIRISL